MIAAPMVAAYRVDGSNVLTHGPAVRDDALTAKLGVYFSTTCCHPLRVPLMCHIIGFAVFAVLSLVHWISSNTGLAVEGSSASAAPDYA